MSLSTYEIDLDELNIKSNSLRMKPQPSNWNTRDSSGRNVFGGASNRSPKGLDETPQSVARGGSLAARGKRVYSSCGSRREYFDAISFSNTQLLLEIWKEFLKRSTSGVAISLPFIHPRNAPVNHTRDFVIYRIKMIS